MSSAPRVADAEDELRAAARASLQRVHSPSSSRTARSAGLPQPLSERVRAWPSGGRAGVAGAVAGPASRAGSRAGRVGRPGGRPAAGPLHRRAGVRAGGRRRRGRARGGTSRRPRPRATRGGGAPPARPPGDLVAALPCDVVAHMLPRKKSRSSRCGRRRCAPRIVPR